MLKANVGDLWDTGQVPSDQTIQVPYAGKPLTSHQRCLWKVRVWDKSQQASHRTASRRPGRWVCFRPQDWHGQWISLTTDTNFAPAPMLRRAFTLEANASSKRASISAAWATTSCTSTGRRSATTCLDPAYTRYDKRDLYVTYDVTTRLRRGQERHRRHPRQWLVQRPDPGGMGFPQGALARRAQAADLQLRVEYADGCTETIVHRQQWKTSTGPIVFDSIYGGETYDARAGEARLGHGQITTMRIGLAARWSQPRGGKLVAQMMPPIKADQVIKPVKLTEPKPGVFVFDMGQNFAGYAELSVRGPAGTKVVMKYGERLHTNGMIDRADIEQHVMRMDTNQQFQTDTYILKGGGRETWHSRFVYHGFQYVEVTGFPGKPTLDNLRGVFLHSAVPVAGEFECSNPLLNKIWRAGRWSYLSNLQGIPTDCPHREKNGWTGDAHLAAEQGLLNFAPAAVYTKWINDLGDEQRPSGELPGIVPTSGWGYKWGNGPAWDSAFLLIPFYLYEYCGDTQVLCDHYDGMKRYVDYLTSKAKDGIVDIGLNDWAPVQDHHARGHYLDRLLLSRRADRGARRQPAGQ